MPDRLCQLCALKKAINRGLRASFGMSFRQVTDPERLALLLTVRTAGRILLWLSHVTAERPATGLSREGGPALIGS
jgi:hypothetical protein